MNLGKSTVLVLFLVISINVFPQGYDFYGEKDPQTGYVLVMKGGKYGYYDDKLKKEVVEPKYDIISPFSEEKLALVSMMKKGSNKWGYVNSEGKETIKLEYDFAMPFSDGLAAVCKNYDWGFIDEKEQLKIKGYDDVQWGFFNGCAWVKKGKRWGMIDKNNKKIVDFKYRFVEFDFDNGFANVRTKKNGKTFYFDSRGKLYVSKKERDKVFDILIFFEGGEVLPNVTNKVKIKLVSKGQIKREGIDLEVGGVPAPFEMRRSLLDTVEITANVSFNSEYEKKGVRVSVENTLGGTKVDEKIYVYDKNIIEYSPSTHKCIALVIGNGEYSNYSKGLGRLENVENDVNEIAKRLRSYGFDEVILQKNLERNQMEMAFNEFFDMADNYEVVFVYYGGHGAQISASNKLQLSQNVLFPINSTRNDELNHLISVGSIVNRMAGLKCKVKMLAINACRDSLEEHDGVDVLDVERYGHQDFDVYIMNSTKAGKVAFDKYNSNDTFSPFASALLDCMDKGKDWRMLWPELVSLVCRKTGGNQEPSTSGKEMLYKFYFNRQ